MKIIKSLDSPELVKSIKNGGVAVIPTDTLYGIVGQAASSEAVEKIHQLKGRDESKPFIVLISSIDDFSLLDIDLDEASKKLVKKYWPGKVSIVFPRASDTLAVRLPEYPKLTDLVKKTGPLVAPSANPEGSPPAKNIQEAINYFGDKVDYYCEAASSAYVDGGKLEALPSTIISIGDKGEIKILRQGAVRI